MKKIKNRHDKLIGLVTFSSTSILTIKYFLINITNIPNVVLRILGIILCASFIFVAIPIVIQRRKILVVVTCMIVAICLLYTCLFFEENVRYYGCFLFEFLCMCLPLFFIASSIEDEHAFLKGQKYNAYIIVLFVVLTAVARLIFKKSILKSYQYSTEIAYYSIVSLMFFAYYFFKTLNFYYLLIIGTIIIVIIVTGSRGPLLCMFLYLFYELVANGVKKKSSNKHKVLLISCISAMIFLLVFSHPIATWASSVINRFGISSRTLTYFLNGELITHIGGRGKLVETMLSAIKNRPLVGYGLGGDFLLLEGTYAHNLFLELWCNFGIIIGTIISMGIMGLSVYCYKAAEDKDFFVGLFIMGMVPMMFSNSFLTYYFFWIYLGYCMSIVKRHKVKK